MQPTLGSRIAGRRVEKKWTQVDLAAQADLSSRYISELERDEANPSVDVLTRIADALGCSLDVLVGRHRPNAEVDFYATLSVDSRENDR